jgi:hypothetical protein
MKKPSTNARKLGKLKRAQHKRHHWSSPEAKARYVATVNRFEENIKADKKSQKAK